MLVTPCGNEAQKEPVTDRKVGQETRALDTSPRMAAKGSSDRKHNEKMGQGTALQLGEQTSTELSTQAPNSTFFQNLCKV